jgi:pyrroline-5-carboxylate reductase
MTNAGVALGLDKQIAEKLSIQTALGASTMSKQSTDCTDCSCKSNYHTITTTTTPALLNKLLLA